MKNSSPFALAGLGSLIVAATMVFPCGACAGWVSFEQSWYNTTEAHPDFWAAEFFARSFGGHLVAINNQREQDFLWQNYAGLYFIGLTDEAHEGHFEWTNGDGLTYQNWDYNQPDNAGGEYRGGEDYVVMNWNSHGRWNDLPQNWQPIRGIIEVANQGPTGHLALLDPVEFGDSVMLDASTSFDPNAASGDSITSFLWSVGGLSFETSDPLLLLDTSELGMVGTYAVELQLIDTLGASGYANSQLIVSSNNTQPTPEPSTITLFGIGIVGLAAGRWRKASSAIR